MNRIMHVPAQNNLRCANADTEIFSQIEISKVAATFRINRRRAALGRAVDQGKLPATTKRRLLQPRDAFDGPFADLGRLTVRLHMRIRESAQPSL